MRGVTCLMTARCESRSASWRMPRPVSGRVAAAAVAALATLSLAGCVTPQVEEPHGTQLEARSLGLAGQAVTPLENQWWKAFGDPQLNALVDAATRNAPSLAQALSRVRSAQAQTMLADAGRKPGFTVDADETWQRFSENYIYPPPFGGGHYWMGQALLNMNWSLDFWGRQAALIDQSRSQLAASVLDVASARLALAGSIAQAYVDLYRSWQLIDIATRQEQQRQQLLKLTRQRVAAGLDTKIELRIAESALPQARYARLQAESARDLAVHRLAALAGYGADHYDQIARPQLALDTVLVLPDRLPMGLLAHRPDVLAAQARIDAATAGRKAARAAFYPDISLRAFVGGQAIDLDKLVQGDSLIYGVGPALHLPVFNSERLKAGYKSATAELDAAVASYNATVLDAVRETADQISLNESYGRQLDQVQQTLQAASTAYELAKQRYAAGLSTQLVVLDAESRVLDAQRALLTANTQRVIARVTLLLMLGGSFDPAAPAEGV